MESKNFDESLKPGLIYLCKKVFENAEIQKDTHYDYEYNLKKGEKLLQIDYFPNYEENYHSICIIDATKYLRNGILSQLIGEILDGFFGLVKDENNYYLNLCVNNISLIISNNEMLENGFDIKKVFDTIEKLEF